MGHIRDTIHIDAPLDVCWDIGSDAGRQPEWSEGVLEVKDVTGRLDHVGAAYTRVFAIAGRRLEGRFEVVAYLRSLPSLWSDSGPDGRQALATALFARTDVQGFERMEYELTPEAIELGLDAALPTVFEIGKEHEFGRGERDSPSHTDLSVEAVRLAPLAAGRHIAV